jgi:hypothetical protein
MCSAMLYGILRSFFLGRRRETGSAGILAGAGPTAFRGSHALTREWNDSGLVIFARSRVEQDLAISDA